MPNLRGEERRGGRTYSQRDWSSCSARCCPSLTLTIHRSKSMSPDRWNRRPAPVPC
jgi:hypothetical protein